MSDEREQPSADANGNGAETASTNGAEHHSAVSSGEQTKSPRRKWIIIGAAGVIAAAIAGLAAWVVLVPSTDDNYWESLNAQGLNGEYLNQEIAVAQGKGYCERIESGETTQAFWYEKTAVDFYCPEYADAVKLVPTVEEQDAAYLKEIRDSELGGEFASDAAAVAAGRAVCARLDGGGANQGPTSELIAVRNFCPDYAGGFRELNTFSVTGTFVLYDDDYLCFGEGLALSAGYDDIGGTTDVKWENQDGNRLATTTLGDANSAGSGECKWTFTVELPEGEERYLLTIGRRGTQEYTEAELKIPDAVAVRLGSPF